MNEYKQCAQTILDELNVKNFCWSIGESEKGQIDICYNGEEYIYSINGVKQSNKPTLKVIEGLWKK